ncbi:MAG: hypothetical protein P9L97_03030 [Candidatus Tenebribacter davisii]|jgi:hypothetical protein|nr:hypothetical protein [Candidatus Tenebribacter davisii]
MSNNIPRLKWISYPFRDFPISSSLLVVFLIIISLLLWKITVVNWEMPLFFYLGMGIFLISLITYFIPTTYEFYEDRILIRYWLIKAERPYSQFGCYYIDKKGIMLSTFKMPRKLDPFRGLSLRFSRTKEEKDELLKLLDDKIGNRV